MASTGVLPFLRGIDLSRNDLQEGKFPVSVSAMTGLKWVKLNGSNLDWVPEELSKLKQLESVSFTRNNLVTLHGDTTCMDRVRYLNCRYNQLNDNAIPSSYFNKELLVLDLSHNQIREIPGDLEVSRKLLVLNLSHNLLDNIPPTLFVNLNELTFLDLSHNQLDTLPPQLRRLTSLQTLIISDNPLGQYQLRQIPSLTSLTCLNMSNTQRSVQNLPTSLEDLEQLEHIDLSRNQLVKVPSLLYSLPHLKRINLSDNNITDLTPDVGDFWKDLHVLNLARNQITSLPPSICKMSKLRRLFLANNRLDFEGIPSGIGKLCNLEVFDASNNNLEMIPEGVVRCGRLKKLILSHNRLITLPDAIHLLCDIEKLDLTDNPDLVMPPKPTEYQYISKGSGIEYYNIDFSLNNQLRLVGGNQVMSTTPSSSATFKDPNARKKRLRERRRLKQEEEETADEAKQAKVLKGMSDLAREKEQLVIKGNQDMESNLKPKKWDEALEKPPLDYSDFFDGYVGQLAGLTVYEIENFVPNEVDESLHGKFYEGDCYIILKTIIDDKENLDYEIFYWIGAQASLDKKACAAIHAVNLRNFLGARCRTIREEQGEESAEFLTLFPHDIMYFEGGRTACGFFTVEETEVTKRMYRLHELANKMRTIFIEPVDMSSTSLDSRYVFLVDCGKEIYIWFGKKAKNTMRQKGRLVAEKISREERKNRSELLFQDQGCEDDTFWDELSIPEDQDIAQVIDHIDPEGFTPSTPILYQVVLGMGFLELPQIQYKKLTPSLMETKQVYILDTGTDVFIWLGRKSARLVKAAALKLGQEVFNMLKRPPWALVHRCLEGTEPQLLKSKFDGWDDVIAVDFTRTAESVQKTGADLIKWMSNQEVKVDLSAIFVPRQPAMSKEEAITLMDEWNGDLEVMESFVLEGKKFSKLPDIELGHFYTEDCYVFCCRYWIPMDTSDDDGDGGDGDGNSRGDLDVDDDYKCIVYFWQGRHAGNMGWLTFTFTLQKKFTSLFGDKLEVVRTHQQRENLKFLSHFKQKFIIHNGKRPNVTSSDQRSLEVTSDKELYQLRSNNSPLTLRCIQINRDSCNLNSGFCYLLKCPCPTPVVKKEPSPSPSPPPRRRFVRYQDEDEEREESEPEDLGPKSSSSSPPPSSPVIEEDVIYVWIGSKADESEAAIAESIAVTMFDEKYRVSIINEYEEPDEFWPPIGGRKPYEFDHSFMYYTRLFRCSNDKGYFSISEKCADFCQDDLSDEDMMMLDNGVQTFIWVGSRCSDVEIKLAYKSAQVYVQNMRVKQPSNPRKLMLTFKGKESTKFTKCFHGWSKYRVIQDPRANVPLFTDD